MNRRKKIFLGIALLSFMILIIISLEKMKVVLGLTGLMSLFVIVNKHDKALLNALRISHEMSLRLMSEDFERRLNAMQDIYIERHKFHDDNDLYLQRELQRSGISKNQIEDLCLTCGGHGFKIKSQNDAVVCDRFSVIVGYQSPNNKFNENLSSI